MGQITRISTTPVKGTALQHPRSIELGPHGFAPNRLFYLVDSYDGVVHGKKHGQLVQVQSSFEPDGEVLTVTFPDGTVVSDTVVMTDEQVESNFHSRPVAGTVLSGPFGAAFSAYVGLDVRVVRANMLGDANDVYPVTLISTSTMREFAEESGAPQGNFADRFRMLLELDGVAPFEEDAWAGRRVEVGTAVLGVVGPVTRCAVTNQDPRTGIKDFGTLAALSKVRGAKKLSGTASDVFADPDWSPDGGRDITTQSELASVVAAGLKRGLILGVYAKVLAPGAVRVGDQVGPLGQATAIVR